MTEPPADPKRRLSRRQVLKAGAGAALAVAGLSYVAYNHYAVKGGRLPNVPADLVNPADFSFVHFTDSHIQPELGGDHGVAKAIDTIHSLPEKPAFVLHGGDLVMDVNDGDKDRADLLFGMWASAAKTLNLPVYYCIGNHDVYAEDQLSDGAKDPDLGKGMWKRRVGYAQTYNTFDCAGWRFIILDSVQLTPDGSYTGGIDKDQMAWLGNLLRNTPRSMPIVVLAHIPVFTTFRAQDDPSAPPAPYMVCGNNEAFREMVRPYNVKVVLQGHTHICEDFSHEGLRCISSGAVCGNLWRKSLSSNSHFFGSCSPGFGVLTAKNGEISYRYVEYGWKPVSS